MRPLVAAAVDLPEDILDDLWLVYGTPIVTTLVSVEELEALIERTLARAAQSIEFESGSQAADDQTANVRDLANQPPVVRYVNLLVRNAYQARASDIHLEAERSRLGARYRIDGVLVPALAPPAGLEAAVVSRIKLLAEIDIAERRQPQRWSRPRAAGGAGAGPAGLVRADNVRPGGSTARGPGSVSGKARPALPQRRGGPRRTRILYGHDLDPVGIRVEGVQDQHPPPRPER